MPQAYVAKLAKEHNISIDKAENYWDKAKVLSGKAGHPEDYDYITGIFKKMMGESEQIDSLVKFIEEEQNN